MQCDVADGLEVFGPEVDATILPEFKSLYRYWAHVKGDRWAPSWSDFHMDKAPLTMIPWCVVVDVQRDPPDFTYRFCGTQIRDLINVELTGKSIDDIPNKSYAKRAREEYSEIIERKVALFSNKAHVDTTGTNSRYQTLRVPFSSGNDVENILSVGGYSRLSDADENYFEVHCRRLTRL